MLWGCFQRRQREGVPRRRSPNVMIEKKWHAFIPVPRKKKQFPLPLTVREAVEVWLPTVKVTVPESALVTPLSVRLCTLPSVFIRFISLLCSGTSWSFHWAKGASSWDTTHSKWTSSPSYTTQLSKNFSMLTSTSVWQIDFSRLVTYLPEVSMCKDRVQVVQIVIKVWI